MNKRLKEMNKTLTPREREMIRLIAEGYKDQELARRFRISLRALKGNQWSLMRKLNLPDVSSVVEYALAKGVITVYEVLESRFSKGRIEVS
jgi:two-component system response regulator NreC